MSLYNEKRVKNSEVEENNDDDGTDDMKIFLAFSWNSDRLDADVWSDFEVATWFRTVISAFHGVEVVDSARATTISEKIIQDIENCDAFFCILTRCDKVKGEERWLPPQYVLTEATTAFNLYRGATPSRGVFGFIEKGINRSNLGIAFSSDNDLPQFDRKNLAACEEQLNTLVKTIVEQSVRRNVPPERVTIEGSSLIRQLDASAGLIIFEDSEKRRFTLFGEAAFQEMLDKFEAMILTEFGVQWTADRIDAAESIATGGHIADDHVEQAAHLLSENEEDGMDGMEKILRNRLLEGLQTGRVVLPIKDAESRDKAPSITSLEEAKALRELWTPTSRKVVDLLLKQTHPLTISEIATASNMSDSLTSQAVTRLEKLGFVRKWRQPIEKSAVTKVELDREAICSQLRAVLNAVEGTTAASLFA